jgi:MoxR-like ATPase
LIPNTSYATISRIKAYKSRIFDTILKEALEAKGAVLIQGPKWCGKTTTAEQVAQSVLYMSDAF